MFDISVTKKKNNNMNKFTFSYNPFKVKILWKKKVENTVKYGSL